MIGEEAHGLFARLRSSVTNKFTTWSKPAAIQENDSDLNFDKVFFGLGNLFSNNRLKDRLSARNLDRLLDIFA